MMDDTDIEDGRRQHSDAFDNATGKCNGFGDDVAAVVAAAVMAMSVERDNNNMMMNDTPPLTSSSGVSEMGETSPSNPMCDNLCRLADLAQHVLAQEQRSSQTTATTSRRPVTRRKRYVSAPGLGMGDDGEHDTEQNDVNSNNVGVVAPTGGKRRRVKRHSVCDARSAEWGAARDTLGEDTSASGGKLGVGGRFGLLGVGGTSSSGRGRREDSKSMHALMEQKRRDDIRVAFESLRDVLPLPDRCSGSKVEILREACEYIKELIMKDEAFEEEKRRLRRGRIRGSTSSYLKHNTSRTENKSDVVAPSSAMAASITVLSSVLEPVHECSAGYGSDDSYSGDVASLEASTS